MVLHTCMLIHMCTHIHIHNTHAACTHTHTQQPEVRNFQFAWTIVPWSCIHTPAHIHACTHRELDDPKNEYVKQYLCHFHWELSVMTRLIPRKMSGREHPSLCQLKTSNDIISDIYVFLQRRSKESQRNQCACHQHQSNINWLILDDVGF